MTRTSRADRYGRLFIIFAVVVSSAGAGSAGHNATPAQQPGAQASSNFTGKVTSLDASDLRSVRFRYEAGARSNWHVHDGALVVLVEQGRGRFQLQGQTVQELVPGRAMLLPAGVPHWHGAAPDESLTWVALNVGRDTKWMGPVSDQEYLGGKR